MEVEMCLLETCFRAGTHACLAPTSVRKKEPAGNKGRIILRSDKKARRGGNPCAMYCGNPTGRPAKAKHRKAAELLEGRPPSDHAAPLPPSLWRWTDGWSMCMHGNLLAPHDMRMHTCVRARSSRSRVRVLFSCPLLCSPSFLPRHGLPAMPPMRHSGRRELALSLSGLHVRVRVRA